MKKKVLVGAFSAMMALALCGGVVATKTVLADTAKTDAFVMAEGASIRLSDPSGIRFQTKLGQVQYEALTAQDSKQSLHMLIVPEAYYAAYQGYEGDQTIYEYLSDNYQTLLNLDIPTEKIFQKSDLIEEAQSEYEDGYYYAHGVIQSLHFNSYANDFVGIAYLKTTDGDTVTYQDAMITTETPARSAYEVALRAYDDYEDKTQLQAVIDTALYYKAGVRLGEDGKYYVKNAEDVKYETLAEVKSAVGALSVTATAPTYLFAGNEGTVSASLLAGEAVANGVAFEYESSNDGVITVDENGKLTAVATGTAEITVTTAKNYSTAVTVQVLSDNLLDESMLSYWGRRGSNTVVNWDAEEKALKVTAYEAANSIYYGLVTMNLVPINEYFKLGYRTFAFKIKGAENAIVNETSLDLHLLNPGWVSGSTLDIIEKDALSTNDYATAVIRFNTNGAYETQFKNGFAQDGLMNFEIDGNASPTSPTVLYLKDFYPVIDTVEGTTLDCADVNVWQGFNETLAPALSVGGVATTDTFTYATTNPNVAIVDANGKVTGVAVGKAEILVSSSKYGISKLVKVNVSSGDIFGESMVSAWGSRVSDYQVSWNATEGAMEVTSYIQANSFYYAITLDATVLGKYFAQGYKKFTFDVKVSEQALANGVSLDTQLVGLSFISGSTMTIAPAENMRTDGYVTCTIDFTGSVYETQYNNNGLTFVYEGETLNDLYQIVLGGTITSDKPSTVWLKNFQAVK